ncbi:MAG: hypothetical protein K0S32_4433 [Bacteroidetes bacterium]|jgi:Tfp pilus assembly protein PilN|nr:hypothetical protein [Bacteroidota bacterium]
MFWDKWIPKKYLVKSEICGVEVNFSDEGVIYHYSILKNKGKKLELTETGTSKDELKLPKSIEKNKIPLVLVINGKGVILKKISLSENSEASFEDLIKSNLPTINPDEFFIQIFRQENFTAFITLCRKEQINNILSTVRDKNYQVANVLIGPPSIIGLQPLWNNFNSLPTSLHKAELTNGFADTFSNSTEKEQVKIEDISFQSDYTLGFSGALSYLMQNPLVETNNEELLAIEKNHKEKNKLRFIMIVLVAITFTVAAVNVFFYTSYFDKNNKLETELSVYQGKYEQINQLLADYQKKKDLIENAGILNRNKLSEYADKIAKTIPDEVVLSELYFNPKDESEDSEDSLVKFRNKELIIKGNCNKSLIINEWVNVLKMQKFVKDVSLEKFAYNNEGILPNYEIKLLTE